MQMEITTRLVPLLTVLQNEFGIFPASGCLGNGRCGRCRVRLVSGQWIDSSGKQLAASEDYALACKVMLKSASGIIEFNDSELNANSGVSIIPVAEQTKSPQIDNALSIDIGTTCIEAAYIQHGEITGTASIFNPQGAFGDNVISRIAFCENASGLATLRTKVQDGIKQLIGTLGCNAELTSIAISANTTMACIFHGISPCSIGKYPFQAPCLDFQVTDASILNLPHAVIRTIPAISAFIGGDITAGLCAAKLQEGDLLADIGTNCELVLNTGNKLICTSAAAGPALEGAGLAKASRAIDGAINHIFNDMTFSSIGSVSPIGLCGSAMIDMLAVARQTGLLDANGRTTDHSDKLCITSDIFLTEEEIAELIKAKAAIAAGIKTLSEYTGTKIRRIFLAGNLAYHLDTANAVAIGMLPQAEFIKLGNSSLAGAIKLAICPAYMDELQHMAKQAVTFNLNEISSFQNNFFNALTL